MGIPHSPKLQQYLSLTIRLFSTYLGLLLEVGVLLLCRDTVGVFYSPKKLGCDRLGLMEEIRTDGRASFWILFDKAGWANSYESEFLVAIYTETWL